MAYNQRKSRSGFVDIEMRDETNMTMFKIRGQKLGNGIKEFEEFLEHKLGIRGFSPHDFEEYLERRVGLKGFSAHDFEEYVKQKK